MTRTNLSAERLRALLAYDLETGRFTWRVRRSQRVKAGDVAGTVDDDGYVRIGIDGRWYRAHRLAWFHVNGVWPQGEIDHEDTDRQNNSYANLRDGGGGINQQNRRRPSVISSTGFLGVFKDHEKFVARIKVKGSLRYLGTFATPETAYAAYVQAKRSLHPGSTL